MSKTDTLPVVLSLQHHPSSTLLFHLGRNPALVVTRLTRPCRKGLNGRVGGNTYVLVARPCCAITHLPTGPRMEMGQEGQPSGLLEVTGGGFRNLTHFAVAIQPSSGPLSSPVCSPSVSPSSSSDFCAPSCSTSTDLPSCELLVCLCRLLSLLCSFVYLLVFCL